MALLLQDFGALDRAAAGSHNASSVFSEAGRGQSETEAEAEVEHCMACGRGLRIANSNASVLFRAPYADSAGLC